MRDRRSRVCRGQRFGDAWPEVLVAVGDVDPGLVAARRLSRWGGGGGRERGGCACSSSAYCCLVRRPRRPRPAGALRQRDRPTRPTCGATPAPSSASPPRDPALPAPDQRQDRTLPPHPGRGLGLQEVLQLRIRPTGRPASMIHQYNHHRPHSAIGKASPITRLDNLAGHHTREESPPQVATAPRRPRRTRPRAARCPPPRRRCASATDISLVMVEDFATHTRDAALVRASGSPGLVTQRSYRSTVQREKGHVVSPP